MTTATKAPKGTAKKTTDYAALAKARLQTEVTVAITARGKKDCKVRGLLLAYLPPGVSIADAEVRVADLDIFSAMPKAEYAAKRQRAEVCVVRMTDPDTGKVRFLTPRAQQVVWS